jgi:hypothetical protein
MAANKTDVRRLMNVPMGLSALYAVFVLLDNQFCITIEIRTPTVLRYQFYSR